MDKVNTNVVFYFYSFAVNRWLGTRLELIGASLVLVASIGSLLWYDFSNTGRVSWIALAITTTLAISANLNWFVRQLSDMEVQMNAVR
jgi:hypothetical protein